MKNVDAKKAAALLRQAAANIETALVLLDMDERRCGECRTRHWNNLTHAKTYQQFTNSPHSLRTAAEKLEQDGNGNAPQAALSAKEQ